MKLKLCWTGSQNATPTGQLLTVSKREMLQGRRTACCYLPLVCAAAWEDSRWCWWRGRLFAGWGSMMSTTKSNSSKGDEEWRIWSWPGFTLLLPCPELAVTTAGFSCLKVLLLNSTPMAAAKSQEEEMVSRSAGIPHRKTALSRKNGGCPPRKEKQQ